MPTDEQRRKAERFLALHKAPPILVLPNAWDACSGRLFELEGFKAIGTTSAGIVATLGYPDGQRMSLKDTIDVVRRIGQCVRLPVSADIEAGYATSTDGIVNSARAVLDAGAVGLNLEDSTGDPSRPLYDRSLMAERIKAIREMALSEDIALVVNARTDVYLVPDQGATGRVRHAVERADAYRRAGADCIFIPDMGDLDKETIARLVDEIDAPLNIIAGHTTPPIAELEGLGVSRVSLGPRPMRAGLALIREIARELLDTGTYTSMTAHALSYSEVNRMFERQASG